MTPEQKPAHNHHSQHRKKKMMALGAVYHQQPHSPAAVEEGVSRLFPSSSEI